MNENGPLTEVITAYLQAIDAGQTPDQDEILARHPDLTIELRRFFATQDRLNKMAEPLQPELPAAGRMFGDYEILGEIGRGGMGVVYRARQISLGREVAVKVLLGGSVPAREERLRQEAEILARLDHSGIVPVYEVGVSDGQAFFAMKLVAGASLTSRLGALRIDLPRAIRLLVAVARVVHYAHERGVVHRDLKPANILLDATDAPFVTDFGLALRLDGDDRLTASGAVVGTPAYMAPEQADNAKAVGPAADVWALGVILYEVLTGHVPFAGATALETLHQVMRADPPPLGREVRGWARVLEGVCLRCLRRDPGRRYPSAGELADDLECWLRHELPRGSVRRSRRLRLRLLGKCMLFVALLIGVLVLWGFDRNHIAQRNVERAAYALEKGDVQLARETLEGNWTPRWILRPSTNELFDDALALTEGLRADLGEGLELSRVCYSADGQLVRLRRIHPEAIQVWERWRKRTDGPELRLQKGTSPEEERKLIEEYNKKVAEWERQKATLPREYTFHHFDTQTGEEQVDANPPETLFPKLDNIHFTDHRSNDIYPYIKMFKQPFTGPAEAAPVLAVLSPRNEWWATLSADGHLVHCFRRDGTAIPTPPVEQIMVNHLQFEYSEEPCLVRATYDRREARWSRLVFVMPTPKVPPSAPEGERTDLARGDLVAYEMAVYQGKRSDNWDIQAPPPLSECEFIGRLHLPRCCIHEAQLSLDGKVLLTRTRRQAQPSVGLWRLP